MRPIPQTIEVAAELRRLQPDFDVLAHLQGMADAIQELVPDCLGLSIAWLDQGVAFTLVASTQEIAVLDAVQYLAGGPCVRGVAVGQGVEMGESDLLDEHEWQAFGRATAHAGVASTLTLVLVDEGEVVGSANVYGASDRAFEGHHEELARILGARVSDVVRNADLSFSTRAAAERSPATLESQHLVDTAVGLLVGAWGIDVDSAQLRLEVAADRAGISKESFAQALVGLYA